MADHSNVEFPADRSDDHWSGRKAFAVLISAWSVPALATLALLIPLRLWVGPAEGGIAFAAVITASLALHMIISFGLLLRCRHLLSDAVTMNARPASNYVLWLALSMPNVAGFLIASILGKAYLYAFAAMFPWAMLYHKVTIAWLGPAMRRRAPAIWPATPERSAVERRRVENVALQIVAALYIVPLFLLAVAVIVAGLLGR